VDNQVYFITARCRERYHAFESEEAKAVFWDPFYFYTSLLDTSPGSQPSLITTITPLDT